MQSTYEELLILIQQLKEKIQQLESENKNLKDKLNTNSSNSSQPPSQDPYRKPKQNKKTGRAQGAQKGHRGYSRRLIPLEEVQTLHDLKPNVCPNCQSNSFDEDIINTDVRQVLELPEMPPDVTQ
jgi:transposase